MIVADNSIKLELLSIQIAKNSDEMKFMTYYLK